MQVKEYCASAKSIARHFPLHKSSQSSSGNLAVCALQRRAADFNCSDFRPLWSSVMTWHNPETLFYIKYSALHIQWRYDLDLSGTSQEVNRTIKQISLWTEQLSIEDYRSVCRHVIHDVMTFMTSWSRQTHGIDNRHDLMMYCLLLNMYQ